MHNTELIPAQVLVVYVVCLVDYIVELVLGSEVQAF